MVYFALKYLHLIGATVLLGTGAGIAFFMLMAHRTGEAVQIAAVARIVVVADFLFTATAVIAQPVTGIALAWHVGYSLTNGWIALSILHYIVTGCFLASRNASISGIPKCSRAGLGRATSGSSTYCRFVRGPPASDCRCRLNTAERELTDYLMVGRSTLASPPGALHAALKPYLRLPLRRPERLDLRITLTAGRGPTAERIDAMSQVLRDRRGSVREQSCPSRGRYR